MLILILVRIGCLWRMKEEREPNDKREIWFGGEFVVVVQPPWHHLNTS